MIAMAEAKPDLAKYDIREEIGHGGMATVYLARDKRLGRDVAIKIIHRHLRENVEVAARFASEARAVAKLKHPNIVEVYDVSDDADPERYLVVELVRGATLRAFLTDCERLPAEIAAIVAVEVAEAIDHAHQLGVIHRDVKPENVLIAYPTGGVSADVRASSPDDGPLVKITDFGIAKLLDAQGVTSTGQVLGSPAHMAPEQIEGGDVTARSDVFGLGVLLYESCVGRLPFDGKNPAQVLRRVLDGAFTPADKARPTVGMQFGAVIGKALAHEPSGRFATAEEFAKALRDELTRLGFTDLRGELRSYLQDPKAYLEAYEQRVVERLMLLAGEARARKDIPCSAADLNRALAFRPDDARLLAEVMSLGRSERLRRNIRSALLALGGSAVVAAAAFGLSRIDWTVSRPLDLPPPKSASPVTGPTTPTPAASTATAAASGEEAEKPRAVPSRRPAPRAAASASAPPAEVVLARVRIAVDGPANATVKVDGAELADWFGTQLLPVGPHVFEFIPPNNECCEPGEKLSIAIREPRGPDDLQKVRGRIAFKNAILDVRGTPGSKASCAELGEFPVPSHQTFGMTTASRRASCTVIPPPGSGLPLKTFDVTLSPGRVSSVPPGP
jgi:tRNA A-37 threonylcarbamoyl transferase component Bud32